jgi:hypothetical protein
MTHPLASIYTSTHPCTLPAQWLHTQMLAVQHAAPHASIKWTPSSSEAGALQSLHLGLTATVYHVIHRREGALFRAC